jgi:hypothetical protein
MAAWQTLKAAVCHIVYAVWVATCMQLHAWHCWSHLLRVVVTLCAQVGWPGLHGIKPGLQGRVLA